MHKTRKIVVACTLLLSLLPGCAEEKDDDLPAPPPAPVPVPVPDPVIVDPVPYDDVVQLEVRNLTASTVYGLYVSPSTDDSWGPNLLRGRSLSPGSSSVFTNEYCDAYYDLRADDLLGRMIASARRFYFRCGKREIVELRR